MKHTLLSLFAALALCANADNDYHYSVDLTRVTNDKVTVELRVPDLSQNEVEFAFPAMVPGTYEVYDFGRFISNFKVSGKNGATITVTKKDVNTYRLSPAAQIEKISYDVDDTWDKTDLPRTKHRIVFDPGRT